MMNCNKFSTLCLDKDYTTARCNRAKLDTGTFCNYDCEFCYYQGLLDVKTSYEDIITRIDKLHEYGITEVDLSGGESSVHKQWFDILKYCNERFTNISTLSNGWAFAKEDFLVKSKECGLTEILFSVHGFDEQSHDTIVRRKGAWRRIMKAIKLAHDHGIVVRINCTVYQRNHTGLSAYDKVIKKIKPLEVNFLTLNYWVNNKFAEPINYESVTNNIKKCIDKIVDHVKYINVRYTPYCYMVGYEKYVCNHFQHIYDKFDWNKEIYDYNSIDTSIDYTHNQKIDMAYDAARIIRLRDYKKPIKCLSCKYYNICDGVEKQVEEFDAKPVKGRKITDVNQFRHGFYEDK
jgi:MoaA/NifB/PqqE/SkfB family radical SAM enzyme